jgi:hypothetical protein
MIVRLTDSQKTNKVKKALKIIHYSIDNNCAYSIASKKYKEDRRFIYNVNRRWIIKNSKGVPTNLVVEFKRLFQPK